MHWLGVTRTSRQPDHALLTPDSFVRAPLPGMDRATAVLHASSALGAGFLEYTAEFEKGGSLGRTEHQRFIYVLEGKVTLNFGGGQHRLGEDHYAYLPAGAEHSVLSDGKSRAAVIEKPYVPLAGVAHPAALSGKERDVRHEPMMGDKSIEVRSLLPADVAFDMAVNTMCFDPGAALPMVESHVMEHGLLMLEGSGIYRLGERWYPVTAGDFIWMAPWCPQWFAAVGKSQARYLIYKNWNR